MALRFVTNKRTLIATAVLLFMLFMGGFLVVLASLGTGVIASAGDEGSDESAWELYLPFCDEIGFPDPNAEVFPPHEPANLGLDGAPGNVMCSLRPRLPRPPTGLLPP